MMLLALLLAAQTPEAVRAGFRARLDDMVAGRGYTAEQLNSRWLNSAMAARDTDARALFRRVYVDQWVQQTDFHAGAAAMPSIRAETDALFRRNADWLKAVLARIGWFDIGRYGAEASQAAWLIVQHADFDPDWQEQMLAALGPRVARGDMQPNYYAYLADRIAVNRHRPQTYGTQGHCVAPGDWQPFDLVDPANLDARRAAAGLTPIAEYRARFGCRR